MELEMGYPPAVAVADGEPTEKPLNYWYIAVAQSVAKIAYQLQNELMGQKLIQYFVEWCQTPDCRVKGICFEDCSYLYDVEGVNISWVLKRSSENNIYIGIPTSILQGVDQYSAYSASTKARSGHSTGLTTSAAHPSNWQSVD
jgi:hypothetical protein